MPAVPKERRPPGPPPRPRPSGQLDDVDRAILRGLARDGRQPNSALADEVGVAPSTCLVRTRDLRRRGVLRGVHADVDLAALGRPVQAMVAVRLAAHSREAIDRFRGTAPGLPGVVAVYHVSGATDYVLHVAVPDAAALRDFVLDHVTSNPAVAHAETSLIFEHVRGEQVPGLEG
ncbi:MAG TPA: Lrp/AsnC family transcriptional regulator [Jiangellales bacterium]|nr:Lrp/AsnC family transcriptional regulator [Jiangellales bacterium]